MSRLRLGFVLSEAVDGLTLDLAAVRPRTHPWNFENLAEPKLRGLLGCALSHLDVWRQIAGGSEPALVFEDDAKPIRGGLSDLSRRPANAGLIWLNDYDRGAGRLQRVLDGLGRARYRLWAAETEKSTEAYWITPPTAALLHAKINENLGAIDEHIRACIQAERITAYELLPALFTQADRSDTDIQIDVA